MSEGAARHSGRVSHFLFGSSPRNLLRALRRYGGVSGRGWQRLAFIALGQAAFSPFGFLEQLVDGRRIAQARVEPAPIFIVGHWRSGTTFLHNLLCRDPNLAALTLLQGCIPWNFLGKLGFLRWCLRRCLPEDRLIDGLPLDLDGPIEEGLALANMSPYSFWQAFYFPQELRRIFRESVLFEDQTGGAEEEWDRCLRFLMKKLSLVNPGKRLVLKDPANTARILPLLRIYPEAKFIHLSRNPYEVFLSMRRMYGKLLPEVALQTLSGVDIDEHVLECYRELEGRYRRDKDRIPAGQLVELSYEELKNNPLSSLKEVYHGLSLPGWEHAEERFKSCLSLQANYRPKTYQYQAADLERVKRHWQFALERWESPEPGIAVSELRSPELISL